MNFSSSIFDQVDHFIHDTNETGDQGRDLSVKQEHHGSFKAAAAAATTLIPTGGNNNNNNNNQNNIATTPTTTNTITPTTTNTSTMQMNSPRLATGGAKLQSLRSFHNDHDNPIASVDIETQFQMLQDLFDQNNGGATTNTTTITTTMTTGAASNTITNNNSANNSNISKNRNNNSNSNSNGDNQFFGLNEMNDFGPESIDSVSLSPTASPKTNAASETPFLNPNNVRTANSTYTTGNRHSSITMNTLPSPALKSIKSTPDLSEMSHLNNVDMTSGNLGNGNGSGRRASKKTGNGAGSSRKVVKNSPLQKPKNSPMLRNNTSNYSKKINNYTLLNSSINNNNNNTGTNNSNNGFGDNDILNKKNEAAWDEMFALPESSLASSTITTGSISSNAGIKVILPSSSSAAAFDDSRGTSKLSSGSNSPITGHPGSSSYTNSFTGETIIRATDSPVLKPRKSSHSTPLMSAKRSVVLENAAAAMTGFSDHHHMMAMTSNPHSFSKPPQSNNNNINNNKINNTSNNNRKGSVTDQNIQSDNILASAAKDLSRTKSNESLGKKNGHIRRSSSVGMNGEPGVKKEVHKEAEKGRRDRLNNALQDLESLIPREIIEQTSKVPSKASTVEMACDYIRDLVAKLEKAHST